MPNWVSNHLKITGKDVDVRRVADKIRGEDAPIDFERVLPINREKYKSKTWLMKGKNGSSESHYYNDCQSEVIWIEKVDGSTETNDDGDTFAGYSYDWYSAQSGTWGTKWNACDVAVVTDEPGMLELVFDTAWSASVSVIERIASDFPEVKVEYFCTEESNAFFISGCSDDGKFVCSEYSEEELVDDEMKRMAVVDALEDDGKKPDEYDIGRIVDDMSWYLEFDDGYAGFEGARCVIAELPEDLEEYRKA